MLISGWPSVCVNSQIYGHGWGIVRADFGLARDKDAPRADVQVQLQQTGACLLHGPHSGSASPHLSAYLSSVGRLCGKLLLEVDRGVLQLLHCLCCLRAVPGSSCFLVEQGCSGFLQQLSALHGQVVFWGYEFWGLRLKIQMLGIRCRVSCMQPDSDRGTQGCDAEPLKGLLGCASAEH